MPVQWLPAARARRATELGRCCLALSLAAACFDCGGRSGLLGSELREQADAGSTSQGGNRRAGSGGTESGGSVSTNPGGGFDSVGKGGTSSDGGAFGYGGAAGTADAGMSSGGAAAGQGGQGGDAGSGGAGGDGASGGIGGDAAVCGNGIIEDGEPCDDGNASSGDGCKNCVGVVSLGVGNASTCAVLSDDTVRCFGYNAFGTLGLGDKVTRGDGPGEMGDALPALDLGASGVVMINAYWHSCALFQAGTVKCWASNSYGGTGLGLSDGVTGDEPGEMGSNLPFVDVGASVVSLDIGSYHTCALLQGGAVKCWGYGELGQLGLGDSENRGDGLPAGANEMGANLPEVELGAPATAIEAGLYHSCALLEGGSIKCWGNNYDGQLGQGHANAVGNAPNQMGANLPAIELGAPATALSAGYYHTCALLQGGAVKCWGSHFYGQLGLGDSLDFSRGDQPNEMGDNLPPVDLGASAVAIGAGAIHTCALLVDGRVKCWGYNQDGRLGLGDLYNRGDDASEMGANLPAVDLGPVNAVELFVGGPHQCVRLDTGVFKCWGYNGYGQLGLGDTDLRGDSASEMGALLPVLSLP